MATTVDLFAKWGIDTQSPVTDKPFAQVRFSGRETAVIPFTSSSAFVHLHYVDEPGNRGYFRCNGADCVLCRLGVPVEERALVPMYLPSTGSIGIVPVSPCSRPGALRPQLLPFLQSAKKQILFIKKSDQLTFTVGSREADYPDPRGDKITADFQRRLEAGELDLTSVYPSLSNEALARIPGISRMLQLRG